MTTHNIEKTEGVVLKTTPYKESDAILSVYTYQFGKISVYGKGLKKINSKNARGVTPSTLSLFELNIRQTMSSLVRASGIEYYTHIQDHIETDILTQCLLEYYYRYIPENKPDQGTYLFLIDTLKAIDAGYSYKLIYALILVFIMKDNGIELEVDGCVHCGHTSVTSFSLIDGGFVCHKHQSDQDIVLSIEALKAIRHIYKTPIAHIDSLNIEEKVLKEILFIFEYYIDEYCGIYLNALSFVKEWI